MTTIIAINGIAHHKGPAQPSDAYHDGGLMLMLTRGRSAIPLRKPGEIGNSDATRLLAITDPGVIPVIVGVLINHDYTAFYKCYPDGTAEHLGNIVSNFDWHSLSQPGVGRITCIGDDLYLAELHAPRPLFMQISTNKGMHISRPLDGDNHPLLRIYGLLPYCSGFDEERYAVIHEWGRPNEGEYACSIVPIKGAAKGMPDVRATVAIHNTEPPRLLEYVGGNSEGRPEFAVHVRRKVAGLDCRLTAIVTPVWKE